jgi:hypothetical protein
VAVGLQGTHVEFLGQGEGLPVVGFGLHDIGGIGMGLDDAKLVQCERLVAAFLKLPGQVECLAGVLLGLLTASRQMPDLAELRVDKTLRYACAYTFAILRPS